MGLMGWGLWVGGTEVETPEFVTRNIEPHDSSTEDWEPLVTSQCLRLTNLTY